MCQILIYPEHFLFGGQFGPKQVVNLLIKIIYDVKIETGIFEISNVLNFNKF